MPARPLSDETVHLIDAVRDALVQRCGASVLEERALFGCWAFFVHGKLCIGVKNGEMLVRLPPEGHGAFQEMPNTRELSPGGGMQGYFWIEPQGFARAAQWAFWLDEAVAYNPRAKAAPRRRQPAAGASATSARAKPAAGSGPSRGVAEQPESPRRRHSIFEADD